MHERDDGPAYPAQRADAAALRRRTLGVMVLTLVAALVLGGLIDNPYLWFLAVVAFAALVSWPLLAPVRTATRRPDRGGTP